MGNVPRETDARGAGTKTAVIDSGRISHRGLQRDGGQKRGKDFDKRNMKDRKKNFKRE